MSDFDSKVEALKRLDRGQLGSEPVRKALAALLLERPDVAQGVFAHWRAGGIDLEPQAREDARALSVERGGWGEPEDLGEDLLPVPPFDYALLPEPFRDYVIDVSYRLQTPPEMLAAPLMTAAGAVIGRQLAIRPRNHDTWAEVPNMFCMIVADPGSLKSAAQSAAVAPVVALEEWARIDFDIAYAEYAQGAKLHKMREAAEQKAIAKALANDPNADITLTVGPAPTEPKPRRYIVYSATVQKLAELMQENPNGLLMDQYELPPLLTQLAQEERAEDRGFFLKGWNGKNSYGFDTISRGVRRVDCVTLSIIGGAQPGPLRKFLQDAIRKGGDDGLFARFGMLVWPDSLIADEVDAPEDELARQRVFNAFLRLNNISSRLEDIGATGGALPYLRYSPEGRKVYVEWAQSLARRFRAGSEHPALVAHCSKYKSLVPSLALTIAMVEGEKDAVSESAVKRAVAWADFLEAHARRAYGSVTTVGVSAAKLILEKLRTGQLSSPFTAREIKNKQWGGLSGDSVEKALEVLEECGWVRGTPRSSTGKGGRPTVDYVAHPGVL
jgi:hypothetical protein